MEWKHIGEGAGDGIIKIELRDTFKPYLLGTSYCDYINIWWDTDANEYDESVCVYAVERTGSDELRATVDKVESWYDCEIIEALKWVGANLT